MKKDSLISFRVSKDLHDALARVSKEDQRSLSSTIVIALTDHLKVRKAFKGIGKEKRQYPRKIISLSAVINGQEHKQMIIGTILEISLGGVTVLIPKDFMDQALLQSQGSRFDLVFNLPAENKPIRLSCEASRVFVARDSLHIGAFFVDADFKSYKSLQTYLM